MHPPTPTITADSNLMVGCVAERMRAMPALATNAMLRGRIGQGALWHLRDSSVPWLSADHQWPQPQARLGQGLQLPGVR